MYVFVYSINDSWFLTITLPQILLSLFSNIQPCLAKVYEGLSLDHLLFQLKSFIIPKNHGFQRGRSSTTNLLVFQNCIMSSPFK